MEKKEIVPSLIDRDTFVTGSRQNPVLLANVNTPEKWSWGAGVATKALRNLIQGQTVTIETVARDKYRRSVAKVKVDNRSVNAAMRRKGYK